MEDSNQNFSKNWQKSLEAEVLKKLKSSIISLSLDSELFKESLIITIQK
jgi:hypothetical protein